LDKEKIILGIDPGTSIMGFGVIKVIGKKTELLQFGDVPFNKGDNHYQKLKAIYESVHTLVDKYLPDELAIEAPFFGKNVQSMLKLGRAQGVCMTVALTKNIPVFEYSPKKIKLAITGSGNASKEQIAGVLQSIYKIKTLPKNLDATDGLAAALCHHLNDGKDFGESETKKSPKKKSSSWDQFIRSNSDRLK
jgi:crossover junction endodeoxyribonuclease RuvC